MDGNSLPHIAHYGCKVNYGTETENPPVSNDINTSFAAEVYILMVCHQRLLVS